MEALEGQGYLETVCYNCLIYGKCQGSNMENCVRHDDEAIAEAEATIDRDRAASEAEEKAKSEEVNYG